MLRKEVVISAVALLVMLTLSYSGTTAATQTLIAVSPQTTYQTMLGWEATSQCGVSDCPGFSTYSNALFDSAVNDLGINRLRVEVTTLSDGLTFDLARLDTETARVVVPIRQRLAARGESLYVNVNFVGKKSLTSSTSINTRPSVYAQQVLKLFQHMKSTYGFVPDAWEVVLEPGVVSESWTPKQIGDAIVATGSLLTQNGYSPAFIAPSTPCGVPQAINTFDSMVQQVPGVSPYLKELAYHRYCSPSDADLQTVASRGKQYGIKTSQLEHGGADYKELHKDLKLANVSAWQQYTLAFCYPDDNGYQYYLVNGSTPVMGSRTKFLRQYFKFIRSGAVRIGASTTNASLDPVAFINKDGKYVVVVNASAGGTFSVQGLPAGTYGIKYTTYSQYNVDLPDVTIGSGQTVDASIPNVGVITVYAKTGSASAPAPAPIRTPTPTSGPKYSINLAPIYK